MVIARHDAARPMCFVLTISTKTGSVLGVSKGENRDQRRGERMLAMSAKDR